MLGLLDCLRPPGRYEGLDILREQIEFAQQHIHTRFPQCNFSHADIYSALYNPKGRLNAQMFKFPYSDCSFDLVYGASLFTHLLPPVTSRYFQETRRVLRTAGQCLFSFFLLDNYRGSGTSIKSYEFNYPLDGFEDAAVRDPRNPEGLIAYKLSSLERIAAGAGLRVKRVLPGYWSKSYKLSVNEQDLMVLEAV